MKYSTNFNLLFSLAFLFIVSGAHAQDISGTVCRDFDYDGVASAGNTEPGLGGIVVTAYDDAGSLIAQTTTFAFNCWAAGMPDASCTGVGTPALGSYVLPVASADTFRVEFSLPGAGSLDFLSAGAAGNSSVYFAAGGSTVDTCFSDASQFCQDDPSTAATCFSRDAGSPSAETAVVGFPYSSTGVNPGAQTTHAVIDDGVTDLGAVWGLAFDARNNKYYAAANLRRGAALGQLGLGGIYEIDPVTNVATPWTTVPGVGALVDVPRATGFNDRDSEAYEQIGKIGLGDIDISDDFTKLYAMNLNANGSLVEYDLAGGTVLNTYPVDDPGCDDPSDVRPWAVESHDGSTYIGVVCSEEAAGGTAADLVGFVMELTPGAGLGNFTVIHTVPLNYSKELPAATCTNASGWFTWDSDVTTAIDAAKFCVTQAGQDIQTYPSPILADIKFDGDGSMVLGLMDRFSSQMSNNGTDPDPAGDPVSTRYANFMGGDIRRACFDGLNFINEGNPGCPQSDAINFEFYEDDFIKSGLNAHPEVAAGGLTGLYGANEIMSSVYDPITEGNFATGGVRTFDSVDGSINNEYELVPVGGFSFAKSLSLGDLELACKLSPIEVGNRIWNDLDGDGIQDPSEPALAGVTVELRDSLGNVIATAVTDADGNYIFSSDFMRTADTTASHIYDVGGWGPDMLPDTADDTPGLKPSFDANGDGDFDDPGDINNQYTIVIPAYASQAPLAGAIPTGKDSADPLNPGNPGGDASNDPLSDVRDSDGMLIGADIVIMFGTGNPGDNNHALDAGFFVPAEIGDTVWFDVNMDGIQDPGETGVPGVTVELYDDLGNLVNTLVTDANGNYLFTDLPAGDYKVTFYPPTGYEISPQNAGGDDALDSDADPIMGMTAIYTLNPGDSNLTVDLGIFIPMTPDGNASVMWNGFCDQQNFIMMTNICTESVTVNLVLHGSDGSVLGTDSVVFAAGAEIDYSVNNMTGFSMFDYGVVELTSSPGGCIDGAMGLFAPFDEGQYFTSSIRREELGGTNTLFALADGSASNACYAAFNTFNPSLNPNDFGLVTTHWLQLANLDSEKQDFTVSRFGPEGEMLTTQIIPVNPMGRIDVAAGHEDGTYNRYGLVEISPNQVGSNYTAQFFRYGVDSSTVAGERMSSFDLADNCSVGVVGKQYLSVSRGADANNWVELYNLSDASQTVTAQLFANSGGQVDAREFTLAAKGSVHFDAVAALLPGESGILVVNGSGQAVLAKSTSYIYKPDGRIQSSYSNEGRGLLGFRGNASYNTFRNQQNWLRISNQSPAATEAVVTGMDENGQELGSIVYQLPAQAGQDIHLNSAFGLGLNKVGMVRVETSVANTVFAEVVRVQPDSAGSGVQDLETFPVK